MVNMFNRIMMLASGLALVAAPMTAQDPQVIPIGLVESLVKDLSPGKRKIVETDFPDMVKEFTGLSSKVELGADPFTGAKKLASGDWRLGVFQGVEFAWAQQHDSKLQPLMVAMGREKSIHAVLVAKSDSKASGFADFKGKEISLLTGREHNRLFADKGAGGDARKFFAKVNPTSNSEMALDDVLRGKVEAAIVDNSTMESYREIQPGRFKRLKVIAQSEPFPSSVIVYRQGGLSDAVLEKFKTGMLKANDSDKGRDMMANFNIVSFAAPPADYAKQLEEIRKAYPAPKNGK